MKIKDWLFVGFFTPDKNYPMLAYRMRESVLRQGFECVIEERPSAVCDRPPPMPWVLNCAKCAEFCLDMYKRFSDRHIFYLDADAEMLRFPELLISSYLPEFDVGVHISCGGTQVNSGTIIFRRTPGTEKVLIAWKKEQEKRCQKMITGAYSRPYREAWDQKVLQDALKQEEIEVLNLPWQYCGITSKEDSKVPEGAIIAQYQASRETRYKMRNQKNEN